MDTTKARRATLGWLDDRELAKVLGIALGTLRNRRYLGDLPPSSKLGRDHITSVADLQQWAARRKQQRRRTRSATR
jgi:hypothetical protein